MKLNRLYQKAIEIAIENDLRGKSSVESYLKDIKDSYEKSSDKEKKYFDTDKLFNPYSDTRILNGDLDTEVKKIMLGIDIGVGELLLANSIQSDKKIDLIISHHPAGSAISSLHNVMEMQSGILANLGIPISIAEHLMKKRIGVVERSVHSSNYNRVVDVAKLLNLPFMCMHTVADNCVTNYLTKLFLNEKPYKLKNVKDLLLNIPEYESAAKDGVLPIIINGSPDNSAGKIHVDMTGGTDMDENLISKLSNAGVSTVVCMHFKEKHLEQAKDSSLNVIVAGHIASDVLGLNLLFDEIEKEDDFEFVCLSGFKRNKKNER